MVTFASVEAAPVMLPEELRQGHSGPNEPKLSVTVIAARGLRNSDWLPGLGKPDCYCVVTSGDRNLFTTRVIVNSLEPVWNDSAAVNDYIDGAPLEFSIYDKDVAGSDFLGKVVLQSDKFVHGFNGQLQLDQAGKGIQAFLQLKIKVAGKDLPAGAPSHFQIPVEKGDHQDYGLAADIQDGKTLYLKLIKLGPFSDYNGKATEELQLVPGDYIVSVNSVAGSSLAMLEELKKDTKATITVARELVMPVILERRDAKAAFGAEFPAKPVLGVLSITNIGDGLFTEYNKTQDGNLKIRSGDRILAVAGFRGTGEELKSKLEASTGSFQLLLSRPAPGGHWRFWG